MAPQNALGKRVKGVQVKRPFILGTTARPFDPETFPRPDGVPSDHTHSWEVFVKGINDTDITYWLKRVQFKLHESIPNHVRMVDGVPNQAFSIQETGWGEFEITLKFYFAPESGEKPQPYYHHLRLHPYGKTEAEQEASRGPGGEIRSWTYEELLFNEPFETFYDTLTSGARPIGHPAPPAAGGKGKGKGKGAGKPVPPLPGRDADAVWERTALIPKTAAPDQPFCSATEELEAKRLQVALEKVQAMSTKMMSEIKEKEESIKKLKEENAKASVKS